MDTTDKSSSSPVVVVNGGEFIVELLCSLFTEESDIWNELVEMHITVKNTSMYFLIAKEVYI